MMKSDNTNEENNYVIEILKKAESGDAESIYYKGALYDLGELVELNKRKASDLFKEAADKGHPHSMWIHACELLWGIGSYPQSIEKGLTYLNKAIIDGSAEACITKASIYKNEEFNHIFDEAEFNKLRNMALEYDDTTFDPYA